ncbi:MAG: MATE family efflux transporter [Tatlockia sp.]|nr:MATE family efflux transporter [Tatlockia sp.]
MSYTKQDSYVTIESDENSTEHDYNPKALIVNDDNENEPLKESPKLTFFTAFRDVLSMSSALVVARTISTLNSYGNSVILNTHDYHNSSDAAAAGALINTFNGMLLTSLFTVTASNYIKSIPMVIEKNYKEVRENLLRSAAIGLFIITPIGEIAFYFSESIFEKVMHSPVNASQIAASFYKGYMPGLPFIFLANTIQQSIIAVQKPWLLIIPALTQGAVSNLIGSLWALDSNLTASEAALHLGYANSFASLSTLTISLLILRCGLNDPYEFFSARGENLLKGMLELLKVGGPVFISVFTETLSMFALVGFIGALKNDDPSQRQIHLSILQATAIYVNFSSAFLIAISQSCLALSRKVITPVQNAIFTSLEERLGQAQLIARVGNLIGLTGVGLFAGSLCAAYVPATQWLLQNENLDDSTLKMVLYIYLINNLLGQLIDSVRLVSNGSLIGHGDFLMPTLINISSMLGVGISMGYLLGPGPLSMGILGPFIARQFGILTGAISNEARLCLVRKSLLAEDDTVAQTNTASENDEIFKSSDVKEKARLYSPSFFSSSLADEDNSASRCSCTMF